MLVLEDTDQLLGVLTSILIVILVKNSWELVLVLISKKTMYLLKFSQILSYKIVVKEKEMFAIMYDVISYSLSKSKIKKSENEN